MKTKLFTLALLLMSAGAFAQTAADEAAVKAACVSETEHFDKRDKTALLAGIADVPYASRYWVNNAYNGGTVIREKYAEVIADSPQPTGIKREQSNWQLKTLGTSHYWATYDQTSTTPAGKTSRSKEVRLLEKINGRWQMISVINLPLPKEGETAPTSLLAEFPAMMKARNANPTAFFEERAAPDLAFIAGHDGSVQNKDWLLGLFKNQKSHIADLTNLKIQQVGDLAVVTGISNLAVEFLDGKKQSYKDAFTYTLRWLNGRWMFTNLHHTKIEYK
ncbi:MAG: nuclear transport factor 2 family protein [Rudanella sp.]|nr:nuclear transport factor 2 family protein [Rudanella sp.]